MTVCYTISAAFWAASLLTWSKDICLLWSGVFPVEYDRKEPISPQCSANTYNRIGIPESFWGRKLRYATHLTECALMQVWAWKHRANSSDSQGVCRITVRKTGRVLVKLPCACSSCMWRVLQGQYGWQHTLRLSYCVLIQWRCCGWEHVWEGAQDVHSERVVCYRFH